MTDEKLLGVTLEQLEAMTDEQVTAHFAPFLEYTPMPVPPKPKITAEGEVDLNAVKASRGRKKRAENSTASLADMAEMLAKQYGLKDFKIDRGDLPSGLK